MIKDIDPAYLRRLISGIQNGSININNTNTLPNNFVSSLDDIFPISENVVDNNSTLIKFTFLVLTRDGLSVDEISLLYDEDISIITNFVIDYQKYFYFYGTNLVSLFHGRLTEYILLRSSADTVSRLSLNIIERCKYINNHKWIKHNIGIYYTILKDNDSLLLHLINNNIEKYDSWWIRDATNLLNMLFISNDSNIDYTSLAELLRPSFDEDLVNKGVLTLIKHANKIRWDDLVSYFDETRFQYLLAKKFSQNIQYLPINWIDIIENYNHPLSYTFLYTYKYINLEKDAFIEKSTLEYISKYGSPYHKIVLIMISGYKSLQFDTVFDVTNILNIDNDWSYLKIEYDAWVDAILRSKSEEHIKYLSKIKSALPSDLEYIIDEYWNLFEFIDKASEDVPQFFDTEIALDIALLLYEHPMWEVCQIADKIILKRLIIKDIREETKLWIIDNIENNLYGLVSVLFPAKKYINDEVLFLDMCKKFINDTDCQTRGFFISELVNYLANTNELEFELQVFNDLLPTLNNKSEDIWETQELIRLLNYYLNKYPQRELEINKVTSEHFLLSKISDPLSVDYNTFWKKAESILGFS